MQSFITFSSLVVAGSLALLALVPKLSGGSGFGVQHLAILALGAAVAYRGISASPALSSRLPRDPSGPRLHALQTVGLCAWFGLVFGVLEWIHLEVRHHGFGIVPQQPADVVWMLPLSYTVVFGGLGLGLAAAQRWGFAPASAVTVTAACVVLGSWAQLLYYPLLDPRISLLLAVGIGWRWASSTAGRPSLSLPRRSWIILVIGVAAAGIGMPLVRQAAERSSVAALPAPPQGAPNVLLIVLDTVRADHCSLYGYSRPTTPTIDALADRGVVFDWAIAAAPWTLPSHSSMFTGRYCNQLTATWLIPLDSQHPTLAETLAGRGYATGGFVGNIAYCDRDWGVARGFSHYEDYYVRPEVIAFSSSLGQSVLGGSPRHRFPFVIRNNAATVTRRALRWLDEVGDRPFFAFLNYYDAHYIYDPEPPYDAMFADGDTTPILRPRGRVTTDEEMRRFVDAYDGCLAYIDQHISVLMEGLRSRDLLQNTLIVITSDHGEHFGEHGLIGHSNGVHRPLLRVPLVIVPPGGLDRGQRIAQPVSLRDLAATILAQVDAPAALPGHTLLPAPGSADETLAASSAAFSSVRERPNAPGTAGGAFSLFARGFQLILSGPEDRRRLRLYDTSEDVAEERNLAGTEEGKATAAELLPQLESHLQRQ